jgi:hypothetical protein
MDNLKKQGEEELKRALLMMKYDSKKTLTENVQEVNEQSTDYGQLYSSIAAGITTGGLAGTAMFPGIGTVAGGIVGGVGGLVIGLMNQTGSFENTAKIIESCKSGVGPPTMPESAIRAVATTIYQSIEGLGTNEEGIRAALDDLTTFSDFCKMTEIYENNYGESFGAALDDDFNLPSEWTDYVYTPLRKILERTKVIDETKLEAEKKSQEKTPQTPPPIDGKKVETMPQVDYELPEPDEEDIDSLNR